MKARFIVLLFAALVCYGTLLAEIPEEETVTACGEEYIWNGMVLTESGDYTTETDSTVTVLHLTLIHPEYVIDSATIDYGDSLVWHGRVLRESGTYCDTIMSMQTGCDSIISCLELTILPYVPCITASGTCGDSLTWTLSCDNVLTISGNGKMSWSESNAPWYDYRSTITRAVIEEGVDSIGKMAFYQCNSLTSATISNSVTSIGNNAFQYCSKLTTIEIPNNIRNIEGYAFHSCSGLTAIEIPGSVTSIGQDVFSSCTSISSITVDSTNVVYDSRDNCNAIIETESNTLVVGCQNTVIPDGVISIGFAAFSGCRNLTSLVIPNSVANIDGCAFYYCTGLTTIEFPNSVTSIGSSSFFYCSGLTSISIGDGMTTIGGSAFTGCSSITSISVAEGNTTFNSHDNCNAIVTIASNTLILGCQNTVIPSSVTNIADNAFYGCSGLTSIEIPNKVTSLGNNAFYRCSGLTAIEIPSSVESIGRDAFSDCTALSSIMVDSTNAVYDSRENCNAIIETASNKIVVGCQNTVIPNSVTSIGFAAYSGCSMLTSLVIPESMTNIEDYAFYVCSGLKFIICKSSTPPTLGGSVFTLVNTSIPVYVPSDSIAAYQAAKGWSDFKNILTIVEEEETDTACGEYTWNGMLLTESGDYTADINDSTIAVLHLTLIQPEYETDSITIEYNDSLVWHGRVLRESGTYCDTIMSMQTGCDSVITCLNLMVLPYVPPTVTIFGEEVVITDPEDSTVIMDEVDILGDSTLIYTPADNTLTLSDVLMEAGDSITAAISYTGSDPLTIVLCDSSTIVADTVIASTSDIIITGSGTLVAEGVVPIVGSSEATITFDSVSMIVRSLSSPAAVRRRIRGIIMVDENGGPALSGFASADFNKTAVTPPEAEYNEVTPEEAPELTAPINAMFVRNGDGSKMILTEFTLTAIADPIDAVENISEDFRLAVSKCLINGQLYILLPDGTRYTTTGIKVE